MRAVTYSRTGGSDVLTLSERPVPAPGPGEVRVRTAYSGVNPTDWKSREGNGPGQLLKFPEQVPDQDGSGTVDAVGEGVGLREGQAVWLWECAWQRPEGTAQEYVVVPADHAVPLPDGAALELGASLGIPGMTAHRALTLLDGVPPILAPGALAGRAVLVAGGAGAVGNAAIQLARWAGATVITTISSDEKATLATAAGAHHVVNYRQQDVVQAVRAIAPGGVAGVVEVAPAQNAEIDRSVLERGGTVAIYANDGGDELTLGVRSMLSSNTRWQFVLVYTIPAEAKRNAVAGVSAAVAAGAYRVGEEHGLPITTYRLAEAAAAHDAVRDGTLGKVLIDVRA